MNKFHILLLLIATFKIFPNTEQNWFYHQRSFQENHSENFSIKNFIPNDQAELEKIQCEIHRIAQKEKEVLENKIKQDVIDKKLSSHILENAPERIKSIIIRFKKAQSIENQRIKDACIVPALLFVGPPGVGKTELAKIFANEIGFKCRIIKASMLADEYKNSGAQRLKHLIESLTDDNYVVVIDEINSLINKKKAEREADDPGTALIQLMDDCKAKKNIIFVGTANDITNLPDHLKSRFYNNIIKFELPNKELRLKIFKFYSENHIPEKLIQHLARKTDGFSCRDLKAVTDEVLGISIEKNYKEIKYDICDQAIENIIKNKQIANKDSDIKDESRSRMIASVLISSMLQLITHM